MPSATTRKKARPERKPKPAPARAAKPLKKKPRAEPGPTDVDVDPDVLEFIAAIDRYRHQHSRPFPNWSEILQIVKTLGYRREL